MVRVARRLFIVAILACRSATAPAPPPPPAHSVKTLYLLNQTAYAVALDLAGLQADVNPSATECFSIDLPDASWASPLRLQVLSGALLLNGLPALPLLDTTMAFAPSPGWRVTAASLVMNAGATIVADTTCR